MGLRALSVVVHPRLELPHPPSPLLLGVSAVQQAGGTTPALAQQDWEAGARGRRQHLGMGVEGRQGGSAPAVPI